MEGVEIVLRDSPARRFLMDSCWTRRRMGRGFAEDAVDAAAAAWREFEERMRKPAPEPALAAAGGRVGMAGADGGVRREPFADGTPEEEFEQFAAQEAGERSEYQPLGRQQRRRAIVIAEVCGQARAC